MIKRLLYTLFILMFCVTQCPANITLMHQAVLARKNAGGGASPGTTLLGIDTVGGTGDTDTARHIEANEQVCAVTGTIDKGYVYMGSDSSAGNSHMTIWNDSNPATLLAYSVEKSSYSSNAWNEYDFTGANEIEITATTTYKIGLANQSSYDCQVGATNGAFKLVDSYGYPAGSPATFAGTTDPNDVSIYVVN